MATTNQQGALAKASNKDAVTTAKKQPESIKDLIQVMQPEIAKALPKVMTPERFTRITLSAISNTPKLADCDKKSFLSAMMQAAQAGLEPNTALGQAYLIPYGGKVQYQIGAKGMVELAHRSNTHVEAHEVYENDEFTYAYGLHSDLHHVPAMTDRGKVIGYYAIWKNGENYGFEVMSKEDVLKHAKQFSKTYTSGPWQTNFDEMAKKTVIKKVLKYAPLKTEIASLINNDETIKTNINEDMSTVPNEFFEADVTVFDEETGEVIE